MPTAANGLQAQDQGLLLRYRGRMKAFLEFFAREHTDLLDHEHAAYVENALSNIKQWKELHLHSAPKHFINRAKVITDQTTDHEEQTPQSADTLEPSQSFDLISYRAEQRSIERCETFRLFLLTQQITTTEFAVALQINSSSTKKWANHKKDCPMNIVANIKNGKYNYLSKTLEA